MDAPYIGVRLLKNRLYSGLHDENGMPLIPKPSNKVDTTKTSVMGLHPNIVLVDMSKVFKVPVPEITPRIPKRKPHHSDAYYEALCTRENEKALANHDALNRLLRLVRHYVKNGGIEVVEDALGIMDEDEYEPLDPAESALAIENVAKKNAKRLADLEPLVRHGNPVA